MTQFKFVDIKPKDARLLTDITVAMENNPMPESVRCFDGEKFIPFVCDIKTNTFRAQSNDHFVAVYEDDQLTGVWSFRYDGRIGFAWLTHALQGRKNSPEGDEHVRQVVELIKRRCGGKVQVKDKNPDSSSAHNRLGIEKA